MVGISWATLNVWIARKKVKAPKLKLVGGVAKRLWTARDIARLRETKARIFGKGRGRRKVTK